MFTKWYKSKLNSKLGLSTDFKNLKITDTNLPEDPNSDFSSYKKEVMKNIIIKELNKAISNYSSNSSYQYKLPKLLETEWEQIFNNISITTFLQGVPTGTKYYNGYAIAVSTRNKEYVDPEQIYMITGKYYHKPNCSQILDIGGLSPEDIIGYRSIEFIRKTLDECQYYMHGFINASGVLQNGSGPCYSCLVDLNYNKSENTVIIKNYLTALGRERYVQK